MTDAFTLTCLSWNIHRGRGNDGRVDPARTLDVLETEVWQPGTDVLVLQEADEEWPPHRGILDIGGVQAATGLAHVHEAAATRWGPESHGFLGIIVFLDPSIRIEDIVLLDLPGHCHRGAVVVDATKDGQPFRLIGTHLSLTQVLRMAQLRTVGQHVFRRDARPTILCGDLNEWRPWSGLALSRQILGARFVGRATATFPVSRPVLPLDRILTTAPGHVALARSLDGPGIRMASDHRPLLAKVVLKGP